MAGREISFLNEREIDNLLDVLRSRGLSDAEKEDALRVLLPEPKKQGDISELEHNSTIVTREFVQQFADYRSLGLTFIDAAHLCGLTTDKMQSIMYGEGLTREQHTAILQAEQIATARFKYTNLQVLHDAAQEGKWAAAVALLEKVLPDEYGKRMDVRNNGVLKLSAEGCEAMAQKATNDLQRLRSARRARAQSKE